MRQKAARFILKYLRFFARNALATHKPIVIGITGSVGKSSVRNVVYGLLSKYYPTKMIEKGNSETGIPLGLLGMSPQSYTPFDWIRMMFLMPFKTGFLSGTKYVVLEMGVDEPDPPKNMEYLLSIVKPTASIFLNVFPVHTQQFDKTVPADIQGEQRIIEVQKQIAKEKGKIITASDCSIAIYNRRNIFVRDEIEHYRASKSNSSQQFLAFGNDDECEISYGAHVLRDKSTAFEFWTKRREKIDLIIQGFLLPKEYREVFAPAIILGQKIGLSRERIAEALSSTFSLPHGRASLFEGVNDSLIIDSSYNASKASVLSLLSFADQFAREQQRPLVFIFGDMRELGEEAKLEHETVAEKILQVVDTLYCVGPLTKDYVMPKVEGKLKKTQWFSNVWQVSNYIKDAIPKRALVLVKGSQNTIFLEEAIKWILKNKEDSNKLCRQEQFWMQKKHELFLETQQK